MIEILKDKFVLAAIVALGLCLVWTGVDWMRGYAADNSLGYFLLTPVVLFAFARSFFVMSKIAGRK